MKVVVIRSKVKLSKKNKAEIKAEIMDGIRNGLLITDGTYDLDIMDVPPQAVRKGCSIIMATFMSKVNIT